MAYCDYGACAWEFVDGLWEPTLTQPEHLMSKDVLTVGNRPHCIIGKLNRFIVSSYKGSVHVMYDGRTIFKSFGDSSASMQQDCYTVFAEFLWDICRSWAYVKNGDKEFMFVSGAGISFDDNDDLIIYAVGNLEREMQKLDAHKRPTQEDRR